MKKLIAPVLLAIVLGACSSSPDTGAEQAGAPVEGRDGTVATVTAGGPTGSQLPAILTDPKSILSKRSVYFDYDKYDIKPEFKDLVAAHAKFLVDNRQFKMLIQGHADERGSREYNLALGQKRADAMKRALILLGAQENQVESVSLGEEKPACVEQSEACWAKNRRGDMLYAGEF
ncbi:MAG: peptidoglycan-associated lipoprotein Pal [Azospira sp.]|jgi:peptidoglycan-associated lipoprotein|nr:peptidoglycan-associated lipoprotein Pal [Azospira sp.]